MVAGNVHGVERRDEREWIAVGAEPLDPQGVASWAVRDGCGAVVTFAGTVRETSSARDDVIALEYETDEALAVSRIKEVIGAARRKWPGIVAVGVHHRLGRVELGGVTVLVAVSSPHRAEAFEASQYCIDTVKRAVPMYKREIWEGGSEWSQEAVPIASVDEL